MEGAKNSVSSLCDQSEYAEADWLISQQIKQNRLFVKITNQLK
jgi:hypothetical protein